MALYPEAIVICTVRDPLAWEKSISFISDFALRAFLRFILYPIPAMRLFPRYIDLLQQQCEHTYGERPLLSSKLCHTHVEWFKKVVPQEKLFFFDVRDGWEPLCKILGNEVPNTPFPRINDSNSINKISKRLVTQGLWKWVMVFATVAVVAATAVHFCMTRTQGE
jgi:hypothetical protein